MQEIVEHVVNDACEYYREYDVETPCPSEEPVEEDHKHKGERYKRNDHKEYGVEENGARRDKQFGQVLFLRFILLEIFFVVSQILDKENSAEEKNNGRNEDGEISRPRGPIHGASREFEGWDHEQQRHGNAGAHKQQSGFAHWNFSILILLLSTCSSCRRMYDDNNIPRDEQPQTFSVY
jgi:hypothetical protein